MKSICFTGHRLVNNPTAVNMRLEAVLEQLINDGAEDFYAGGAIGFDTLAERAVLRLRRKYPQIKLHLLLPCCRADQTAKWQAAQIEMFDKISAAANTIEYTSQRYSSNCMRIRNARLVEQSEGCVCYYTRSSSASGTGQTIRMAENKGIPIINVAEG